MTSSCHVGFYRHVGKRFLDVVAASGGLLLLAPSILLLAVLVRWRLGSPVLFRQQRMGLQGRAFTILKFRSMAEAFDDEGQPLPDELRLAPFGRFLRRYRLDEIPELLNVLRGEMSLVGPRPLPAEDLAEFPEAALRRGTIRPGLTGWAQVNGNTRLSPEDRMALDLWYVENLSLWLDLRTMTATFLVVVDGERVNKKSLDAARAECELR